MNYCDYCFHWLLFSRLIAIIAIIAILLPCGTTDAQIPCPISLHVTGPSQCPRVDKPHPAPITGTRLAVAGRARKEVAQVVWNGPRVADGYNWQFPQDTLYRYDVQNRFPVVELVYNPRTNRFQPSCAIQLRSIISISSIQGKQYE